MFGSGHVFDIEDGQKVDKTNLKIEKGKFKNFYFIPEIGIPEIRGSQEGIASIKSGIAHLHAKQFHGGGNVRMVGNN